MEKSNKSKREIDDLQRARDRMTELRPTMHMSYNDPLYIPPEIVPDGWTYYWVRDLVFNEDKYSRLVEAKRKGWMPVPAERHPEMHFEDFFGRNSQQKGYIYYGGLLLCERPKEMGDIERERMEAHNLEIMTNMPGLDNFMGESSIPGRVGNKTYLTRAASFGR